MLCRPLRSFDQPSFALKNWEFTKQIFSQDESIGRFILRDGDIHRGNHRNQLLLTLNIAVDGLEAGRQVVKFGLGLLSGRGRQVHGVANVFHRLLTFVNPSLFVFDDRSSFCFRNKSESDIRQDTGQFRPTFIRKRFFILNLRQNFGQCQ